MRSDTGPRSHDLLPEHMVLVGITARHMAQLGPVVLASAPTHESSDRRSHRRPWAQHQHYIVAKSLASRCAQCTCPAYESAHCAAGRAACCLTHKLSNLAGRVGPAVVRRVTTGVLMRHSLTLAL